MCAEVVKLNCPGCGARVSIDQRTCEYCQQPVTITTFGQTKGMSPLQLNKYASSYRKSLAENPDSIEINTSIAMCYLQLKLFDKALPHFEKALEENFENSEPYFFAAMCLLGGKKPFLTPRPVIDKMIEYLNAAIMIENRGIYHYFMAYVKYDYFHRKFYNTTPNYTQELATARQLGYSQADVMEMFGLFGLEKPACL
ncbi:MAG: tetratricopeptide repeat protein [Clostridia bacterium]|nr:tetratricopeptide repeat protein [Clostridia bacterium]